MWQGMIGPDWLYVILQCPAQCTARTWSSAPSWQLSAGTTIPVRTATGFQQHVPEFQIQEVRISFWNKMLGKPCL